MSYSFLKPKTTNIFKDTWNIVKTKPLFWLPIPLVFIFPFLFIIPVLHFIFVLNQKRTSFWKEFAEINGWKFKDKIKAGIFDMDFGSPDKESGIMFKEGHTKFISNEIDGVIGERHFRIFCYQFSIGSGKYKRTYFYTVFGFKFNGSFPHIYLNNKSNSWNIDTGEKIPLSLEFEKKFSLIAPRKYEIEALEIFTPDVLASLLEKGFSYDVEFVNQEILIFVDGQINDFEKLERSFNKSLELEDLMSKKLDRFKFEQIGDMPSVLK